MLSQAPRSRAPHRLDPLARLGLLDPTPPARPVRPSHRPHPRAQPRPTRLTRPVLPSTYTRGGVMVHTFECLKKMTLAELRDVAKDVQHDAVQGYTQMNKDHLVPALCKALGIDAHEHHAAHSDLKFTT